MAINAPDNAAAMADIDRTEISAPAWTADAYLALGSQYVYRGVALRDEGPVVSGGLSIAHASGWFIDGWAGRVDAGYFDESKSFSYTGEWLFDINAGYGAELTPSWQWSLSRAWIVGVDSDLPASQNYQEWRANLFYRSDVSLQLAYTENYRQLNWAAWNAEVQGQHILTDAISGEWGLGYAHFESSPTHAYHYEWLGLQTDWLATHWRLRWIYSGSDARYVLGDDRRGSRIELALSWHWSVLR